MYAFMDKLKPPSSLSLLQQKILQIVCTEANVTYQTLIEETKRDRITVLQSIESLIKYNYVRKQKRNPEYEKSKLIFKPTHGGKLAALAVVGLEEILKAEEDEEIANYFQLIKDIKDNSQREKLVKPLLKIYTSLEGFQDKKEALQRFRKNVLREALIKGIAEIVYNRNYSAKSLLNDRSIKWLKRLFTPTEIKELKDALVSAGDNIAMTVKRLPS